MSHTPETDVTDLASATAQGAVVVDVREPDEYADGHVPGALNIPLGGLGGRLAEVPAGPVYVVCASGNRSRRGTDVLRAAGREAVSVAGGTAAWRRAGRPVTAGPRP